MILKQHWHCNVMKHCSLWLESIYYALFTILHSDIYCIVQWSFLYFQICSLLYCICFPIRNFTVPWNYLYCTLLYYVGNKVYLQFNYFGVLVSNTCTAQPTKLQTALYTTLHAALRITKETALHTARYTPLFTLHTSTFILCTVDSSIAELSGNLRQETSIHWLLILGIFPVCSAFCTFWEV